MSNLVKLNIMQETVIADSLIIANAESVPSGWLFLIVTLLIVISISVFGFFILRRKVSDLIYKINFTQDYLEKVKEFIDSNGKDMKSYTWLLDRSVKMQRTMAGYGKVDYVVPYQGYKVSNADIIINFVPQIKKEFESVINSLAPSFQTISFYVDSLQEYLIRFYGAKRDELNQAEDELRKPYYWFILGLRQILALPIYIFAITGLLSMATAQSLRDSLLLKFISFLIVMIGLIASIMTIFVGWNDFWNLIKQYFYGA